ncbi:MULTISPECIES: MobF family relaxase [Mumia]|uniref:MobF family relaxase n=1 Tax=Mumia TaxID=1546255 RepID=UPI00141DB59A|nr:MULTISPECIES: MobF family relaxase [unclassified Mumia]QMW66932.1 relaxase domain-containing protein [Mumia sp. ZJ1417]
MTLHKLHAGDGYTYLTRQVASGDVTRTASQSLADYYLASGNPTGRWMGVGARELAVSGTVREDQMRSLFGAGMHPDAEQIIALEEANGASPEAARTAARLGQAFPAFHTRESRDDRIAERIARYEAKDGHAPDATTRARIETSEAAKERRAVAGYDLVFTPVKSASILWGLGDAATRQAASDAHHAAVENVLAWLETETCFARTGKAGVQTKARGFIAAAFDHFDSRSGDPDLHTHVAISNKVRALHDLSDGRAHWLSLDARVLHAAGVAASERYNTRFEDELSRRLGVAFTERPDTVRADKRPVREIAGVPFDLIRSFSQRRAAIEDRYRELAADYRNTHRHDPDTAAQLRLAQQATLDTRGDKILGETLADKITRWRTEARPFLGKDPDRRLAELMNPKAPARAWDPDEVPVDLIAEVATSVVAEHKATWTRWNVLAEIERQIRHLRFATAPHRERVTVRALERALSPDVAVPLSNDATTYGSPRYTTQHILDAEQRLLDTARAHTDHPVMAEPDAVARIWAYEEAQGHRLDPGQRRLVLDFLTNPHALSIGVGPAGSGKTTAMRALATIWREAGRRVIPLAPSATAAQVLADELGTRAENLHKFQHLTAEPVSGDDWAHLRPGDLVLVDEASLAGTTRLDWLTQHAHMAGAVVRLLGDPYQLSAVEAGGAFRLLVGDIGGPELDTLHRFHNPDEAAATLQIRGGDPAGLRFYEDNHRVVTGSGPHLLEYAYNAWERDTRRGLSSIIIASTERDARALNTTARAARIRAGEIGRAGGVRLRDGTTAGVGDIITTRRNNRALTTIHGTYVKNGDRWTVTEVSGDGRLHVERGGACVELPSGYVADHVQLGYAVTTHRAQGATADTAHVIVDETTTREALYVGATRARTCTYLYVADQQLLRLDTDRPPTPESNPFEMLREALSRSGPHRSATQTRRSARRRARTSNLQLPQHRRDDNGNLGPGRAGIARSW